MEIFLGYLFVAFLIERIIEFVVKGVFGVKQVWIMWSVATILATATSWQLQLDMFHDFLGYPYTLMGIVFAGLTIGLGTGFVHDVIIWVESNKTVAREEAKAVSPEVVEEKKYVDSLTK
jgi:hypothetical protein